MPTSAGSERTGAAWYTRLGDWAADSPYLLVVAGTALMAVASPAIGDRAPSFTNLLGESRGWLLLAAGIILWAVGIWQTERRQARARRLQEQIRDLETNVERAEQGASRALEEQRMVLRSWLRAIAADCGGEFGNTERVSLYKHVGAEFAVIGRYANNPDLQLGGRTRYPAGQGCIGRAWTDGAAETRDLPDPEAEANRYFEIMKTDWKIPKTTAERFAMKSRTIVARAVADANGDRVGVLVLESTRPNAFPADVVERIMRQSQAYLMAAFVEFVQPPPPPEKLTAKERGV